MIDPTSNELNLLGSLRHAKPRLVVGRFGDVVGPR
jgi:hypothetical protein